MSSYSIQDAPARRVIHVTRQEGDGLRYRAEDLDPAMQAGAAAAGPGSPVAAALGELRAAHNRLTRDHARLIDSAATQADTAIAAYVAADGQMAEQYGPFPVAPDRPVRPRLLDPLLRPRFPPPFLR